MRERETAALNGSCCKCAGPVHYITALAVSRSNEQPLVALAAQKYAGISIYRFAFIITFAATFHQVLPVNLREVLFSTHTVCRLVYVAARMQPSGSLSIVCAHQSTDSLVGYGLQHVEIAAGAALHLQSKSGSCDFVGIYQAK